MDQVKKEKITFPLNAIMGVYGVALQKLLYVACIMLRNTGAKIRP